MALARTLSGFTRFSGETGKVSGVIFEGANGTSRYVWVDNNGVIRTATAATAEAPGFNFQSGGTIVGGGAATAVTALLASVGTGDDTVADVGGAFNQTTLNNNFRDLVDKINAIRTALVTAGIVS